MTLHQVKTNINNGSKGHFSTYYNFLQELSIVDGVVIKSNRVVTSTLLIGRMLQISRERHMGVAKCRSRARRALYWPKMNCDTRQLYQYKRRKEPLHEHGVLATPWMKIWTDLIVVDYTSNFPEIVKLRGTTSKHVIDALKSIMARFGIPKIVFSDNALQFSGAEFLLFAKFYNYQSKTSSPEYA